ncbi:hypothetical protein P154DRAFT_595817 [Amniculicola lignicola CBS 123094]|uniref:Ubiquitin-like protease family profile domain-containing protein n=1 Tax=Amniculicola lignicola CBS 123094 TaxID=1392246 RepID=A0A6A5WIM2_9PLEO|nr:hypothetical protein P154DRAFT_595817 [Amniculicola lignicola CBS 123094]
MATRFNMFFGTHDTAQPRQRLKEYPREENELRLRSSPPLNIFEYESANIRVRYEERSGMADGDRPLSKRRNTIDVTTGVLADHELCNSRPGSASKVVADNRKRLLERLNIEHEPSVDLQTHMANKGMKLGWSLAQPLPIPARNDGAPGSTYLELGGSMMTNLDWNNLKILNWFTDNGVDMSLELIEGVTGCNMYDILIVNSQCARKLCEIGVMDEQRSWHPADISSFRDDVKRIDGSQDFIFLPINDGYDNTTGTHWTMLLIHCQKRASPTEAGEYKVWWFDSLGGKSKRSYKIAQVVVKGVQRTLKCRGYLANNLHMNKTAIVSKEHCPNQILDNKSDIDEGGSACGPFIWGITQDITRYLVLGRRAGVSSNELGRGIDDILPHLRNRFEFNSANWRTAIQNLITRERRMRIAKTGSDDWWDTLHLYQSSPGFTRAQGAYQIWPTHLRNGAPAPVVPVYIFLY